MTIEELKAELSQLNPEQRAEIASELIMSLDNLSESEIEHLWIEEAMRRDAALDDGSARSTPANEVFSAARARLQ